MQATSPDVTASGTGRGHIIDFRFAPPWSWTSICRPDDPFKTLVREDGALLYGFRALMPHSWQFDRVVELRLRTHLAPLEINQTTESARVPVVVTTDRYPHATLELRAAGHLHDGDRRTDVVLWRITASKGEFPAALHVEPQESGKVFVGQGAELWREVYSVSSGDIPGLREPGFDYGAPALLADSACLVPDHTTGFRPGTALLTEPRLLREGEAAEGALFFPLNHEATDDFDLEWARGALEVERTYWQGADLRKLELRVPDPDVMAMIEACARNILQAREVRDGLPEYQVGPTVYRGLWIVDGHFLLEAAQFLGHDDVARTGLRALERRVRPNGAIEVFPFHIKETAISLFTIVRQWELSGDDELIERMWPSVRRAVDYIRELRERSKERGPESPEYGLMPPAFGDGGISGSRPEYTSALWTLAGLKAITGAAESLGHHEDAERFRAEHDDLMRVFREHAARDTRALPDGTPYLPMLTPGTGEHIHIPSYEGEPHPWVRANPATATWALAHAIYPGEVFAPDDPLVRSFCHLLDLVDDEEGMPAETGWLPYRALWNYAASFYAHVWIYAGRSDKAVDYLYAFANHAAPTRVWREEQSLASCPYTQITGDMPHNWASAEFIRLVRNLLVFERGNTLELLPGLPPEWRVSGEPVVVERTPTRFGPVSLGYEEGSDGYSIVVERDPEWRLQPERCVLHLPTVSGGGGTVLIEGERATARAGEAVLLPCARQITIRVTG